MPAILMARPLHLFTRPANPRSSAFIRGLKLCALLAAGTASAQFDDLLDSRARTQLARALDGLNMSTNDLSFDKDVGDPRAALAWTRELLRQPLQAAERAGSIYAATRNNEALWAALPRWLETDPVRTPAAAAAGDPALWAGLPDPLPAALAAFLSESAAARRDWAESLQALTEVERGYLAANALSGALNLENDPAARQAMQALGIAGETLDRVIAEGLDLDRRPAATHALDLASRLDRGRLLLAGQRFHLAVSRLAQAASAATNWLASAVKIDTELGPVHIGTPANDQYEGRALLILDPGGDDVYGDGCGAANGLDGLPLSAIVDLRGGDRYDAKQVLGAGAALFGAAVLLDGQGDDSYRARHIGQGSALFGVAVLEDGGGDDRYQAGVLAQGSAVHGVGLLRDRAGRDTYELGQQGQAFAGTFGVGLLVDDGGSDRYLAGAAAADTDRHADRFLSLAQGFSIGLRPFQGGGLAALVDREGNDTYIADVFGQGAAYWYAAGFLLDGGGHDSYQVYQYGQGAGIHLAVGVMADAGGDDRYNGGTLTQAAAHDFGVGLLFDRGGADFFVADTFSQGRAMNNGLALLLEGGGDDRYAARDNASCQGIGNEGGHRDYGCLGLLLDLGGRDQYSAGALNDEQLERPLYGTVYDAEAAP
jgi:hypothetical protein